MNLQIVNSKSVLFLGAGASAPLGLRTGESFLQHLTTRLGRLMTEEERLESGDQWSAALRRLYARASQWRGVELKDLDVEMLLDYLDYLIQAEDHLHQLSERFADLARTGPARDFHRNWLDWFLRLEVYIQRVVTEYYAQVDGEQAANLYLPLLSVLGTRGQWLPVFTTNYDWALEAAAEASDSINLCDGFRHGPQGAFWDRSAYDEAQTPTAEYNVALFKLHGSTSWYQDSVSPHSIRKFPLPSMGLGGWRSVVAYPSERRPVPLDVEPYATAYAYLEETLRNTTLCVAIGYSFRDPEVTKRFRIALKAQPNLRILLVDPGVSGVQSPKFQRLLEAFELPEDEWNARLRVVHGGFNDDSFARGAVLHTLEGLHRWKQMPAWVEPL